MSLLRGKSLGMGVGSGEMLVVDRIDSKGAHIASLLPLREYLPGASSPETAIWEPALVTALAQAKKLSGRFQVSVSDDWVRYWLVTPPKGLSSIAELKALAVSRFESLFGTEASAWHVEADWHAHEPMLACALPRSLVSALTEVSRQNGCALGSVVPESVRLLNGEASSIGADGWVCCFGAHSFLALLKQRGRLLSARQFHFDLLPTLPEVLAKLETECLRLGEAMPGKVYLLGVAPPMADLGERAKIQVTHLGRGRSMPKPVGVDWDSDAYRLALHGVLS